MSSKADVKRRRKRALRIMAAAFVVEAGGLWLRTGRVGGNVVVRCRNGHLFTTLWLPAVSVKAIRLGPWRVQRCPVGAHWTLVTPVRESELSSDELTAAHEHRDVSLP
jgi:hypothetical protein